MISKLSIWCCCPVNHPRLSGVTVIVRLVVAVGATVPLAVHFAGSVELSSQSPRNSTVGGILMPEPLDAFSSQAGFRPRNGVHKEPQLVETRADTRIQDGQTCQKVILAIIAHDGLHAMRRGRWSRPPVYDWRKSIVNNEYNACYPEVDKDGRLEYKRRWLHSRRALYSFAEWGRCSHMRRAGLCVLRIASYCA